MNKCSGNFEGRQNLFLPALKWLWLSSAIGRVGGVKASQSDCCAFLRFVSFSSPLPPALLVRFDSEEPELRLSLRAVSSGGWKVGDEGTVEGQKSPRGYLRSIICNFSRLPLRSPVPSAVI